MKKVISVIMLVCMILTMVPVAVAAEEAVSVKPAPADAIVIDELADLVDIAKVGGVYKLESDVVITLDMIDALYSPMTTPAEGEEPAPLPCAHMNADGTPAECPFGLVQKATYKYEMNEDGSHKVDGENNPIYTRSYEFAAPIANAPEIVLDADGNAVDLYIYGGGYSISFEAGIVFTGNAVLFGKTFCDVYIYDLMLGTKFNMIIQDCLWSSANIGVIVSQPNVFQGATKQSGKFNCDNVHVYATVTEGRNHDNHIGGFVGDGKNAVTIKNSTFHGTITKDRDLFTHDSGTATTELAGEKLEFGGFVGTWRCSSKDEAGNYLPLTLENCTNYGDMTTDTYGSSKVETGMGGMVGGARSSGLIIIKNCTNWGTMTTTRNAGGMIGYSQSDVVIENCVNEGTIKQLGDVANVQIGAAGMIGYTTANLTIKNCSNNNPNISAEDADAVISGVNGVCDSTKTNVFENNFSMIAADLTMTAGAAVKFAAPTNLMFQANLSSAIAYDAMVAKYGEANVKYGMYIAKLSDLPAEGGIEALLASDPTKVTDATITWNEDKTAYTAVTGDIAAADYTVKYVAVGYMVVTNADSTTTTLVSTYKEEYARSVDDVAYAAYNDREPMEWDISVPPYLIEVEEESFSCYTMAGLETLKTMFDEANHPVETPAE